MPSDLKVNKKIVLAVFVLVFLSVLPSGFATRVEFYSTIFNDLTGWDGEVSASTWHPAQQLACSGSTGLSAMNNNTGSANERLNRTNINNTASGTRGWQNIEVNFTWKTNALDSANQEFFGFYTVINGTQAIYLNQTADSACGDRDQSLDTNASDTDFFSLKFICKSSANPEYCVVDNLNISGVPARFSWNESTAETTVNAGFNVTRQARVTFSGNHTITRVSEVEGNGTSFIVTNMSIVPDANAQEGDGATGGLTLDVDYYCAPPAGQAEGIYFAQYNITSAQNNSSNYFHTSSGEGLFVNCTVYAPTVTWNETTRQIDTWMGFYKTTELRVTAYRANNDVNVSEVDGNGTSIIDPNATTIDLNMVDAQVRDFNFTCRPAMTQAFGVYWANYTVNSSENPIGQNATIKCNVMPSNLTYNETSPVLFSVAQGTSKNRDIQIWSNGSNNDTNITNAEDGAGNGSSFITKNATNLLNLINGSMPDVRFTCAPPIEQALGIYEYNVSLNSSQNSTTINLTVRCQVTTAQDTTISMVKSTVSFESMAINDFNNTDDDYPNPFVIRNDGNVNVNITIEATNLFSTDANPTQNYQWNSTMNETSSLQNNIAGENLFGYNNMPAFGAPTKCIGQLKDADANDQATININITIPSVETGGNKTSTVTFVASAA